MGLFHRHRWVEVRRFFVPPVRDVRISATRQLLRDLVNGYTVVELRCEDCGDLKAKRLSGDAT
jgi:hypothetical protein